MPYVASEVEKYGLLTVATCPPWSNVVSTVAVLPGTACCVLKTLPRPSRELVAESLNAVVTDFTRCTVIGKTLAAEKLKVFCARRLLFAGSGGACAEVMRNMES